MSEKWSRENDALIAKVAEGLEVKSWAEMPESVQNYDYDPAHFFVGPGVHDKLDAYNADLAAIVRAAEVWRKQGEEREWTLRSPDASWPGFSGCLEDVEPVFAQWFGNHDTEPAEALAWALWKACRGELPA